METLAPDAPRDARPDLRALPQEHLAALVASLGERPFRTRQLLRWLHQKGAASLDEMTDLPRPFREALARATTLTTLTVATEQRSVDGTIKWTFRTHDGKLVESVYMPEEDRKTLCVSSQVGCAVGCRFCMTGTMGLARNLTAGEIVDQVHRANRRIVELGLGPEQGWGPDEPGSAERGPGPRKPEQGWGPDEPGSAGRGPGPRKTQGPRPLTNLVFMGMGEPLANYKNLKIALELLQHEDGPNFSHRHITVSTSGLVPVIRKLGEETPVKLAVSLNATTDAQRDALMPINKRYPLGELLRACREFPMRHGRRITFEYVLLGGVNDTEEDAARLVRLLRGIPAKVNLIPYNPGPGLAFAAPAPERVMAFQELLMARNLTAVVRKNRGRDIAAACGQLAAEGGPGDPRRTPGLTAAPVAR